jgi:hypothetical protein
MANQAPKLTGKKAVFAAGQENLTYTFNVQGKAGLLAGFTDADKDTLSVTNVTANHGTMSFDTKKNTYTLTPEANYSGLVTLNYNVIDGKGAIVPATQSLTLNDVNVGGIGNDTLGNENGTLPNGTYSYNGHSYLLSNAGTWTEAEAQAMSLGGHLVTINDQAEQNWITATFPSISNLWIGYTAQETEGSFKWISGENSTYTNWNSGEPNDYYAVGGEDYTHIMIGYYGLWNDLPNSLAGYTPMQGLIEIPNNGNGILKGGKGNDTYLVDSSGDQVVENLNEGDDTVKSSISYTLPKHVENLVLTGQAVNGSGNEFNNKITGNALNNIANAS